MLDLSKLLTILIKMNLILVLHSKRTNYGEIPWASQLKTDLNLLHPGNHSGLKGRLG
jgi:hypothetical protein